MVVTEAGTSTAGAEALCTTLAAGTSKTRGCTATAQQALSSSRNAFTLDPDAIVALVPVVGDPAIGTKAIATTTPPVP